MIKFPARSLIARFVKECPKNVDFWQGVRWKLRLYNFEDFLEAYRRLNLTLTVRSFSWTVHHTPNKNYWLTYKTKLMHMKAEMAFHTRNLLKNVKNTPAIWGSEAWYVSGRFSCSLNTIQPVKPIGTFTLTFGKGKPRRLYTAGKLTVACDVCAAGDCHTAEIPGSK